MSVRKRNEFLEGDESEEELDNGYDSDEFEDSREALTGRANKRRKTDAESDDQSLDEEEAEKQKHDRDEDLEAFQESLRSYEEPSAAEAGIAEPDLELEDDESPTLADKKPRTTPKSVAAAEKAARKSGVVYISRVPPFMKPQTLRHFLSPHARKGLGRIFLTPEDHAAHVSRVKRGGNKKKSFTDGWVEFVSKSEAKMAAEELNGEIIGGKKGNFYHDDLWNMKYLKGFKWSHLTEQIANENAERAARLREAVRETRRENKSFLEDVERGKMLEGMERKGKAKRGKSEGADAAEAERKSDRRQRAGREFKQRKVQDKGAVASSREQAPQLQRVLKGIF